MSNFDGSSSSTKQKRPRTKFDDLQKAVLEEEFKYCASLNKSRRRNLATRLELNESQIKNWFQNHRQMAKNVKKTTLDHTKFCNIPNSYYPEESKILEDLDEIINNNDSNNDNHYSAKDQEKMELMIEFFMGRRSLQSCDLNYQKELQKSYFDRKSYYDQRPHSTIMRWFLCLFIFWRYFLLYLTLHISSYGRTMQICHIWSICK